MPLFDPLEMLLLPTSLLSQALAGLLQKGGLRMAPTGGNRPQKSQPSGSQRKRSLCYGSFEAYQMTALCNAKGTQSRAANGQMLRRASLCILSSERTLGLLCSLGALLST